MFKKTILLIISIILILLINIFVYYGHKNKVLVLYESTKSFETISDEANTFYNLLNHFNLEIDDKHIDEYKEKEIDKYNYIFIFNISKRSTINQFLLKDLSNSKKQIFWIGPNIEFFLTLNEIPLKYQGQKTNFLEVSYNDNSYPISDYSNFFIVTPTDKSVNVISRLHKNKDYYPYILEYNNFSYLASFQSDRVLYYIFSDYLYDFFNIKADYDGKIFVRIEDVHPFRDCKKLREIADYLYSENIPFMIALIPSYLNAETGKYTTISDVLEFKQTIKYMVSKGGSVVLHGYSHQYYKITTGEGHEFWDIRNDAPLKENIQEWVYDRVSKGVKECLKNGIYPLAFEPPHYSMSQEGYLELKKYFSTIVGQYQSSNSRYTTVTFPFKIKNSKQFNILLPENLGFVEDGNEDKSIENILKEVDYLKLVRDYRGGFFFHAYKDIRYLKKLISSLKAKQIQFYSLYEYNNWVKLDDLYIENKQNQILTNHKKVENTSSNYSIFYDYICIWKLFLYQALN